MSDEILALFRNGRLELAPRCPLCEGFLVPVKRTLRDRWRNLEGFGCPDPACAFVSCRVLRGGFA